MLWRREIIEKLIKKKTQHNKKDYNHKNVSAKQKQ